jgi:ATP-dependent Zn protease
MIRYRVTHVLIALVFFGAGACALVSLVRSSVRSSVQSPPSLPIPVEKQHIVAVHESAHVITNFAVDPGFSLNEVWVATNLKSQETLVGYTEYQAIPPSTPEQRRTQAATLLAGAAAEEGLLNRKAQYHGRDLKEARESCRPQCPGNSNGTCSHFVSISAVPGQPAQTPTERCLKEATQQSVNLVMDNSDTIKSLADLIMSQPTKDNRRTLSAAQVKDFLRDKCIRGPTPTSN